MRYSALRRTMCIPSRSPIPEAQGQCPWACDQHLGVGFAASLVLFVFVPPHRVGGGLGTAGVPLPFARRANEP